MEQLHAFVLFALVTGFTPGPNNLMLATSGVNHGLKRTLPHMLGVSGPRGQFIAWPWLETGLENRAGACGAGRGRSRPAAEFPAGGGIPVDQSQGASD